MSSKDQVCGVLKTYFKMVQTQFGKNVRKLRTYNGSEFINRQVQNLLADCGIIHQRTCVYTPQQNGIIERRHKMLLNSARALMF